MKVIIDGVGVIENIVDVMVVADKVRYADRNGNQFSESNSSILKFISDQDCMVVVEEKDGDTHTFSSLRFAEIDEEYVYMSGSIVERMNGDILRVREHVI